jgi:hypothetical protein
MNNRDDSPAQDCVLPCNSSAERLNRDCFCTTLNREQLHAILQTDTLNQDLLVSHPFLFSNTTVFISPTQLQQMSDIIQAVTRVVKLPQYEQHALARTPSLSAKKIATANGVFMGYDFHLSAQGAKIIEINTNAGGAFLNAALISAQTECCRAAGKLLSPLKTDVESQFIAMFLQEWQLERGDKPLSSIAIIDDNPQQQFLYPEFKMAKRLFEQHGIMTVIADPNELKLIDNKLYCQEIPIDLVYNRLTDFSLVEKNHTLLHYAYQHNVAVITPNPYLHALYADKRNLVLLSDGIALNNIGASGNDMAILQAGIPRTKNVIADNADALWAERKKLFFKPASGFGSRAAYRGDKLTKRVWDEILHGDAAYIAQELIPPSERGILVDEHETALKMDIRAYVYDGEIQLLAARLYQGQTTNFRTQGGGFAPVFVV